MASDPALVERLRAVLAHLRHVEERRMFGGACFTLNGNMCVGVHNTNLILRVGEARAKELLTREGVKPMDLTGKVMKGWATILPEAIRTDAQLSSYAQLAVDFVETLPPK
jgi:TfoX/Sxy family transcriptional regulator of competence genes